MTTDTIRVARGDGVAAVTLAHPPLNILTRHVLNELRAALTALSTDHEVRVLLLEGDGKHFSAGADVGEHLPPSFERLIPEFLETIDAIVTFPVPVIAAVQGRCVGGGFEVALAADLVVAAEDALFGQPEIALGVMAPAACALLPRRVGWGKAAEITFTGELLRADEAQRCGIATEVVAGDELAARGRDLAGRIARHSAAALRVAKRALLDSGFDVSEALTRAGDVYLNDLMVTADAVEGLTAFLEKRPPVWTHQ